MSPFVFNSYVYGCLEQQYIRNKTHILLGVCEYLIGIITYESVLVQVVTVAILRQRFHVVYSDKMFRVSLKVKLATPS